MAIKDYTRVGTDVRKIARLLQAKAPPGHFLAYINPQEADLLKARGGKGTPHEDTGIPSYEDEGFSYDVGPGTPAEVTAGTTQPLYSEATTAPTGGTDYFAGVLPTLPSGGFQEQYPLGGPAAPAGFGPSFELPTSPKYGFGAGAQASTEAVGAPQPSAPKDSGILKSLGMGLAQAIPGALLARRAAGQAGGQKREMEAVAQPYRQMGQTLQAQAGRGELTPQAQQAFQAAQAQMAQQAQRAGGVGAAQAVTQLESFRQQLLQQQMDYGLKLSGIGDQIALGAIKAGAQADQMVNQLTSSFFNNLFRQMTPPQGGGG